MSLSWKKKYRLIKLDAVDSTNLESIRMAKDNIDHNCIILSKYQTSGRGTKGRSWISPEGNFYGSILLQTQFNLDKNIQLPFLVSNVVRDSIDFFAKKSSIFLDIKQKWPNDILVGGKKIAGILVESTTIERKNYVVIGIGVNLSVTPKIGSLSAISIKDLGVNVENINKFLSVLMPKFDKLYEQWKIDYDFTLIRTEWMGHAYNLDQYIKVNDGIRNISGIFKGIDLNGAMCLKLSNGELYKILSGDIVYTNNSI